MTNLNTANIGQNKFCGPAVLSILTGKSTDECAAVISRINGQYKVVGVELRHLLAAADKLGYDNKVVSPSGSLFGTITRLAGQGDGMYIVTVPNHFVVVEVNEKRIYFCDNHTKEPIPAAASARLLQKVVAVNQVFKRREPEPTPKVEPVKDTLQVAVKLDLTSQTLPNELSPKELEMVVVLRGLKIGDCWCQVGIGNPMYPQHTGACNAAKRLYLKLTERE